MISEMNSLSNGAFKHRKFLHFLKGKVIFFLFVKDFYVNIQPVTFNLQIEDYLYRFAIYDDYKVHIKRIFMFS